MLTHLKHPHSLFIGYSPTQLGQVAQGGPGRCQAGHVGPTLRQMLNTVAAKSHMRAWAFSSSVGRALDLAREVVCR